MTIWKTKTSKDKFIEELEKLYGIRSDWMTRRDATHYEELLEWVKMLQRQEQRLLSLKSKEGRA